MRDSGVEGARALFAANRAEGRLSIELAATSGETRAARTREEGSLRVRFPANHGGAPEAVLVNTAGGMAGGDRFTIDLDIGPRARLTVTTASAEKVYRSLGPASRIDVTTNLADDAELTWLPQETILFDRASLMRRVDVAMAPTAKLVFAETVVFGRTAMGESVAEGLFFDCWRIRRGGRLVFAENFSLDGAIAASLRETAVANAQVALGTLLLVPGNDEAATALRAASADCRGELGVSAWNGITVARFAAADGATLRHDLIRVMTAQGGATLPRLWLN
jgi:urease accessory protein